MAKGRTSGYAVKVLVLDGDRRSRHQLARYLRAAGYEVTAGAAEPRPEAVDKNPHAAALGQLGGLVGGRVRAARLSARQRCAIARKAARARWSKTAAGRRHGRTR